MIRLHQAIVVEGKYDKNTLAQLVDAPIFVTNGFGIMKDMRLLTLLRRVAAQRGLIVLTDSCFEQPCRAHMLRQGKLRQNGPSALRAVRRAGQSGTEK